MNAIKIRYFCCNDMPVSDLQFDYLYRLMIIICILMTRREHTAAYRPIVRVNIFTCPYNRP
jgi:hypothetical protein